VYSRLANTCSQLLADRLVNNELHHFGVMCVNLNPILSLLALQLAYYVMETCGCVCLFLFMYSNFHSFLQHCANFISLYCDICCRSWKVILLCVFLDTALPYV